MIKTLRSWAACALLMTAGNGFAAGMTTHAMMADVARHKLPPEHPLIAVLQHHRAALIAGAMFPDGGYFTGAAFEGDRDLAETAHWDSYTDALAAVAHEAGCADISGAADPWDSLPILGGTFDWAADELARELPIVSLRSADDCGTLVAFLMGIAAHGMGDEVWDALFEPSVYQRGEMHHSSPGYLLDSLPPGADPSVGTLLRGALGDAAFDALAAGFEFINGVEYAMDVIAIRDKFAWDEIPALVFPPSAPLSAAFARLGLDYDGLAIQRAAAGTRLLVSAERVAAAVDYVRVRDVMPYAVSNYETGSGGIHDVAQYIAGYYEHLWDRVVNGPINAAPPFVVGVHPRPGERNLPTAPCLAEPFAACEDNTRRPIADRYIYFALSASPGSDFSELEDAVAVFDEQGNKLASRLTPLPPWASPMSAHGMRIELLDKVLKPQHRYTVTITSQLYDRRGPNAPKARLAQPMIWHFQTGD